MNPRKKISRQKDILGTKEKPQEVISSGLEDSIEVVSTYSLQGKKRWTGENIVFLVGSYEAFKEKVFILAEKDEEYKRWLQTTSQNDLAKEWGVDQSTISRLLGPLQKDHKNKIKEDVKRLRGEGLSVKEIIFELSLDVDESTVRRWLNERPNAESKIIDIDREGSTEYDLKIYKLQEKLKIEKEKNESYRKEIKLLKSELNALRAKYAGA